MSKIVLTLEQIKELARFAEDEGQPSRGLKYESVELRCHWPLRCGEKKY
ncbi:TPA: hypothetical protein ACS3GH_000668 [Serratia marcescens]